MGSTISFRRSRSARVHRFHLRCLPGDFPAYDFTRSAAGGPALFSIQLAGQYAAIFDRDGVPVWWYRASGEPDNVQVLPDGTVAFDPVDALSYQTGEYEIRTLKGRLIRVVRGGGGTTADVHEIQQLPGGNYLIGAQITYGGVDTSPYGGAADSQVVGIEIQEVTPSGAVVWTWDSKDHIGLDETGRWWNETALDDEPYDVVHWNSAEPVGKRYLVLSFRHLDAVYEIDRKTGRIVWKLGGTETPKSLEVTNDPHGAYPLGGQHDARILPNGDLTVHDNRTYLGDAPRIVRYKIDTASGTARLVQAIADPDVTYSTCCGSARRLSSGDWLVNWGGNGLIAGYSSDGRQLFGLSLADGFSYRANPVPEGAASIHDLRHAMDVRSDR